MGSGWRSPLREPTSLQSSFLCPVPFPHSPQGSSWEHVFNNALAQGSPLRFCSRELIYNSSYGLSLSLKYILISFAKYYMESHLKRVRWFSVHSIALIQRTFTYFFLHWWSETCGIAPESDSTKPRLFFPCTCFYIKRVILEKEKKWKLKKKGLWCWHTMWPEMSLKNCGFLLGGSQISQ